MASLGRMARRQALPSSSSMAHSARMMTARPSLALFSRSSLFCSSSSPSSSSSCRRIHSTSPRAMKAGRVTEWGRPPRYMDVPDLPPPAENQLRLRILAAGVPRAVLSRAAGLHPTTRGGRPLPFDPSLDAVGRDEASGRLYFVPSLAAVPVLAEYANVDRTQAVPLDEDGAQAVDPVAVAALARSVQSAWMALRARVVAPIWGPAGRPVADPHYGTVAVLGATSNSGRCAVQVARRLGAKTVVGLARHAEGAEDVLGDVAGLDVAVPYRAGQPISLPPGLGPVHIVLDYVGGDAAVQLLQAAEADPVANLQYVVLAGGHAEDETLALPLHLLGGKPIRVMGSGPGSWGRADVGREMAGMVGAMAAVGTPPFAYWTAPLSDIETVWTSDEILTKRLVLVP